MIKTRYISLALAFAFTSIGNAQELRDVECACDPLHFAENFKTADRVFRGRIVSGQLDINSESVDFKVEVVNQLRGRVDPTVFLSTPLKESCGFSVLAGVEWVFVQRKGDQVVSRCDLQPDDTFTDVDYFTAAVALVDHASSAPAKAKDALASYLLEGVSASDIWMVFDLAQKLDPSAPTRLSEAFLSFRNLEVIVSQSKVVSHVWR
ncbi:MAG: hypothetical protein AB8G18_12800 [Gammaproteobacteria bacterium]